MTKNIILVFCIAVYAFISPGNGVYVETQKSCKNVKRYETVFAYNENMERSSVPKYAKTVLACNLGKQENNTLFIFKDPPDSKEWDLFVGLSYGLTLLIDGQKKIDADSERGKTDITFYKLRLNKYPVNASIIFSVALNTERPILIPAIYSPELHMSIHLSSVSNIIATVVISLLLFFMLMIYILRPQKRT